MVCGMDIFVQDTGGNFHLIEHIVLVAIVHLAHQVHTLFIIRDQDTENFLINGTHAGVVAACVLVGIDIRDQLIPGGLYRRMGRQGTLAYFLRQSIINFCVHDARSFFV